uniref:Uncharacterized protein n=1 Tax=Picea glauca TaxID=3330 RepID=A0A117NHV2_PICGL|nr:hypothetical protein ABT39_MTgene4226 [Picea glauca]
MILVLSSIQFLCILKLSPLDRQKQRHVRGTSNQEITSKMTGEIIEPIRYSSWVAWLNHFSLVSCISKTRLNN